jgi:putative ABC transport system substrate-binding protein
MRRRKFIAGLGAAGAYVAVPRLSRAQQDTHVRRLAMLALGREDQATTTAFLAWRNEMAKLGWVEGRNLQIDVRFIRGGQDRLIADAEELVNLRPDVIFAGNGPASVAFQQRTSVIPIVFVGGGDPASAGLVRNMARPEGNMTGFANWGSASQGGRWLELFKEAVPRLTRVADIFFPNAFFMNASGPLRTSIAAAAAQHGVTIIRMPVQNDVEMEHAISAFAAEPDGGLLLTGAVPNIPPANFSERDRLISLVARRAIPAVYSDRYFLLGGGLVSCGPLIREAHFQAGVYTDRILNGEKAGDLPVQQITKIELGLNLKTAKMLGITFPTVLLTRADELIE